MLCISLKKTKERSSTIAIIFVWCVTTTELLNAHFLPFNPEIPNALSPLHCRLCMTAFPPVFRCCHNIHTGSLQQNDSDAASCLQENSDPLRGKLILSNFVHYDQEEISKNIRSISILMKISIAHKQKEFCHLTQRIVENPRPRRQNETM